MPPKLCFFYWKGVDVIVNASSVEDIDAGAIGQRLSNGLARLSSPVLHRLRLREDENTEPVGTTYQKTDAAVEMKRINREQFWEQAKVGSAIPKPSGPGVPTRACRVALTSLG